MTNDNKKIFQKIKSRDTSKQTQPFPDTVASASLCFNEQVTLLWCFSTSVVVSQTVAMSCNPAGCSRSSSVNRTANHSHSSAPPQSTNTHTQDHEAELTPGWSHWAVHTEAPIQVLLYITLVVKLNLFPVLKHSPANLLILKGKVQVN